MSTIKPLYAAESSLTVTMTSLANAAARESTVVDNTTNRYSDALLMVKSATAAGTVASDKLIRIWAYSLAHGSAAYTDGATGADASFGMPTVPNLVLVGTLKINTAATVTRTGALSVAAAFGGILPSKWGIIVENRTNLTLSSTAGDHGVSFIGVNAESV